MSGPRPGSFGGGGAAPDRDRARGVAVHAARLARPARRVLHRHRQLGVGAGDRAPPARLEAVAGALLRHQELAHAQEAPLEAALERAHRPLAERQAADRELLGERGVAEHHRPLAHDRRRAPRGRGAGCAARAATPRSRPTWRTPATGRAGRRRAAGRGTPAGRPARLGRRRQRGARRPEREAHDGRELDLVLARRGERQALDVRQAVRDREPSGRSGRPPRSRRAPSRRARPRRACPTRPARAAGPRPAPGARPRPGRAPASTSAAAVGPSGRMRRSVSSRRSSSSRSSAKGRAAAGRRPAAATSRTGSTLAPRAPAGGRQEETCAGSGIPGREPRVGDRLERLRAAAAARPPSRRARSPSSSSFGGPVRSLADASSSGERDDARRAQLAAPTAARTLAEPPRHDVLDDRVERPAPSRPDR